MPYSIGAFDYWMSTMVDLLQPGSVCDIGPGAGKYGQMVKSRASSVPFECKLTAVEIDETYVQQFGLRNIYDEVIIADAASLIENPRHRFDLVIIGDCIEHMKKSAGLDLLNFLIYRSGYICIIVPEGYVQDDYCGHAAEAHISTWSLPDLAGWDVLHKVNNVRGVVTNLFLIKGYQHSRMRITG